MSLTTFALVRKHITTKHTEYSHHPVGEKVPVGYSITFYLHKDKLHFQNPKYRIISLETDKKRILFSADRGYDLVRSMNVPAEATLLCGINIKNKTYGNAFTTNDTIDISSHKMYIKSCKPIWMELMYNGHKIVLTEDIDGAGCNFTATCFSYDVPQIHEKQLLRLSLCKESSMEQDVSILEINERIIEIMMEFEGSQSAKDGFAVQDVDFRDFLLLLCGTVRDLRKKPLSKKIHLLIQTLILCIILFIIFIFIKFK